MLDALHRFLAPALIARAALLANLVLASEPVATQRLMAHAGKGLKLELTGLPPWLPAPPSLFFVFTPAGLLDWQPEAAEPSSVDLVLRMDTTELRAITAHLLAGQRPPVAIEGDAALAADVAWVLENVRWDLAADLERFLPGPVVQQLVLIGRGLSQGLQAVVGRMNPAGRDAAAP